jgi:hypothetical protein
MRPEHSVRVLSATAAVVLLVCCSYGTAHAQKVVPRPSQGAALPPDSRQLLALLPEDNVVPGWTRNADARFFGPENLFEHIDGAAEGYLNYGFRRVVTAKYTSPKKSEAVIDIYWMKDARNAFGIYASELNPEAEFRPVGAEGYLGRTALNFWAGPYYVKMRISREGEEARLAMTRLAERCSQRLGNPGAPPAELASFPRENQVAHSVRFLSRNVLGHTFFPEGFKAQYRQGTTETELVIVSLAAAAAARDALAKYRQFTATSGKVERELKAPADGGFAGKDGFYGDVVVVRSDNRILIALGGSSSDAGLALIKAALQNVSR